MLDFNSAKPQGFYSTRQLNDPDYPARLKERMAPQARSILAYLWPNGRVVGTEFQVGSVNGEKGKSLSISLRPDRLGVGCDFAGNEVTRDLIDAWSYAKRGHDARGSGFNALCEEIEDFLGYPFKPQAKQGKAKEQLGPPTATYFYTDSSGAQLAVVYRYELADGSKTFRPWNVATKKPEALKDHRPLYNQVGIKSEEWIVFVEGEKAAEALIQAEIPATCAMNGAHAPTNLTDWTPLAGKHVLIWPDADEPGAKLAEAVYAALLPLAASARVLEPPTGKTDGWDAADAIAEGMDVRSFLNDKKPKITRIGQFKEWLASSFDAHPKPVDWCIKDLLPLGKAGLLVAMGDAGKGILTIDLGLKVAIPKPDGGMLGEAPKVFGCPVVTTGAVVILTAEDDKDVVHRRLQSLDPECRRHEPGVELYVVPLPNAGGPLPIFKTTSTTGPVVTPEWDELRAWLLSIPNLKLIVFDPMASFVHADINADPAAGAFVTGVLASLATETGAAVLLPHHMSKQQKPIVSPEQARAAVRGSTAIVDGVRFVYALWQAEEPDAKRICEALSEPWQRTRVFRGAIVKTNDPADKTVRTYLRSMETGLLVDRTDAVKGNKMLQRSIRIDAIHYEIAQAASDGFPYAKTGERGIWERRFEMSEELHNISKVEASEIVHQLLRSQRIAQVRISGITMPWLDDPNGDLARGTVQLQPGVRTRPAQKNTK